MDCLEVGLLLGPVIGLAIFLPWLYCQKLAKQQWISTFSSELSKEWHKPNKAYVTHVRSQARIDVLKAFQHDGLQTFSVHALDELNDRLAAMEEKVETLVRPIWTSWLGLLVFAETLQYLAVPFASKIKWDSESAWKIIPNVFGCFLPDPTTGGVYDITTWVILLPLYLAAFCILWLLLFGALSRWIPFLKDEELQEYLGNTFLRLTGIARSIFICSKELFFDFGTLFIFSAIVRSCLQTDGALAFYWPSSLLTLCIFYAASIFTDQLLYSTAWISHLLRLFAFEKALTTQLTCPMEDHHYFKCQTRLSKKNDLRKLTVHFFGHQRPAFASRWTLLSGTFKLFLAVLYNSAHFDGPWAWILLGFSTAGFLCLLYESVKHGPCTFHWVNVCRNLGLFTALWGNTCAFLAQSLNSNPQLTYPYTPTIVFLSGLLVILASAPFCFLLSLKLFTCSPVRLHPLKLQVIHAYYKFVALGRINFVKNTVLVSNTTSLVELRELLHHMKFQNLLNNEHECTSKKLIINHELWVTWLRKNSQFFTKKNTELSMQDEIRVCSKKHIDCEEHVSEDREHLQTAQKIKDWMKHAEMVIDPKRDIELGLHVPYDEYLTFSDGAPKFTSDPGQRVFPERCLHRLNSHKLEECVADDRESVNIDETINTGGSGAQRNSLPLIIPSNVLSSSIGTIKDIRSNNSSHPFIQAPIQDQVEKPNKVGSFRDATTVSSVHTVNEIPPRG